MILLIKLQSKLFLVIAYCITEEFSIPYNISPFQAAYQLCPHHVSHYLGMDIHDTPCINRNIPIEPGMVITIEPGKYIEAIANCTTTTNNSKQCMSIVCIKFLGGC